MLSNKIFFISYLTCSTTDLLRIYSCIYDIDIYTDRLKSFYISLLNGPFIPIDFFLSIKPIF